MISILKVKGGRHREGKQLKPGEQLPGCRSYRFLEDNNKQ
jgi:hypothetical protein